MAQQSLMAAPNQSKSVVASPSTLIGTKRSLQAYPPARVGDCLQLTSISLCGRDPLLPGRIVEPLHVGRIVTVCCDRCEI